MPTFDKKFKTVIRCANSLSYMQVIEWINDNSNGNVQAIFVEDSKDNIFYVGFENLDDALLFKIKYKI